tara:strand:+ start:1859 stop:2587 length:729 start_codon:yes stop_codon:yes gene_type:complete
MNIMPKIEMPAPPPEPEPEPIVKIHSEVEDDLPELDVEVKEEVSVDEKEDSDEEIFDDAPPKVLPLATQPQVSCEFSEPVKKGKRKYERKAPMSEKQKEHLAKIRVIASEKRAKERTRKAQEKEDALVLKAQKKIEEKNRKKQVDNQEAELQRKSQEENNVMTQENVQSKATPLQQNSFTKDDLDNAVLSAITSYDQLRKKQKAEKKIQQKKDEEEAKMKRVIQNAIAPPPVASDPWRNLFT